MAVEPKSAGKLFVACKLPHGLKIQFYRIQEPLPPVPEGEPIRLAGSNAPHAVGGYGITPGVDADRFNSWLAQNKNYAPVRAKLIFAEDTYDKIRARAAEQSAVVSGFEGIDPEKPGMGVKPENYEGRPKSDDDK